MELNNFGFNKGECIHCPTKEEAIQVLKIAHERGYRWVNGDSYLEYSEWDDEKKSTCYYIHMGKCGGLKYANNNFYKVIQAKDFLKQHSIENNHKPYLVWN